MGAKVTPRDPKTAPRASAPRYSDAAGWCGGDSRTLYAYTDTRTGAVAVHPGAGAKRPTRAPVGPVATVAIATRSQALAGWSAPLDPRWIVASDTMPEGA